MPKKRKPVEKLGYKALGKRQLDCPECFGKKQPYCRKILCGKWFDECQVDDILSDEEWQKEDR